MKKIMDTAGILNIDFIELSIDEDGVWYKVGKHCDSIEPYYENGEMAEVLWFAIIKGKQIIARVNGKFVQRVVYKEVRNVL
jgi:hypothetical protein